MPEAPLILCVDDDEGARFAVKRTLEQAGFRTAEAATGGEALERMEQRPDLVILDVQLPDLNGFEVCRRIRADPRTALTPVLQISADFTGVEHRAFGLEQGADAYLTQPLEPLELIATIRALLRARRAEEERERLLAREQAARASLEEADQRKDEFLAMLAHELRNPLAAITAGLHVLDEISSRDPEPVRTRATILRQVGVLTRLVDDLLDVSRITRGKVELRKEPVDAREVVQHAIATARPVLEDRRHRLALELDEAPLWVSADPTRLEQVIGNLLHNAAKYTEPGGNLAVSLRREEGEAVIAVRDDGIGIEPAMLDQVFELFAQVDQSPGRTRGGLGVGLTLVKQLVEMHGGKVRARSEGLSRGAEFEVRLPLLAEAERAADRRARRSPEHSRKRLLLIEDNPDLGETLRDLLQLLGHRVELAPDGVSGLQAALAHRPEVALVDIGLPGIDGYEVARRLRATEAGREMVLVALTGYGRGEDRDRALASGFDAHLVKPVEPEELNRLLADLQVKRAQAAGQAPAASGE